MNIIVTDTGFAPDTWPPVQGDPTRLDLGPETQPETLLGKLENIQSIRIEFPSFADGRGFTIARILRLMGYHGVLRARGHIIADQYAMARRSGFDEVEITQQMARRQPPEQWQARANWREHDYQSRMRHAV